MGVPYLMFSPKPDTMFRFTVIILLLVAGLPARGQIDLKVDFGPVFFEGIGVGADFGMSDQHAFVAGVNYLATDYNSEF